MILMVDNYDSFTWNVVQYLWELGADVDVQRNEDGSLIWLAIVGILAVLCVVLGLAHRDTLRKLHELRSSIGRGAYSDMGDGRNAS